MQPICLLLHLCLHVFCLQMYSSGLGKPAYTRKVVKITETYFKKQTAISCLLYGMYKRSSGKHCFVRPPYLHRWFKMDVICRQFSLHQKTLQQTFLQKGRGNQFQIFGKIMNVSSIRFYLRTKSGTSCFEGSFCQASKCSPLG